MSDRQNYDQRRNVPLRDTRSDYRYPSFQESTPTTRPDEYHGSIAQNETGYSPYYPEAGPPVPPERVSYPSEPSYSSAQAPLTHGYTAPAYYQMSMESQRNTSTGNDQVDRGFSLPYRPAPHSSYANPQDYRTTDNTSASERYQQQSGRRSSRSETFDPRTLPSQIGRPRGHYDLSGWQETPTSQMPTSQIDYPQYNATVAQDRNSVHQARGHHRSYEPPDHGANLAASLPQQNQYHYAETQRIPRDPPEPSAPMEQNLEGQPLHCRYPDCGATFSGTWAQGNLTRHLRNKHSDTGESRDSRDVICDECKKSFGRKDALLKHRRDRHPELEIPPPVRRRRSRNYGEE